jgi:hypothetical protein
MRKIIIEIGQEADNPKHSYVDLHDTAVDTPCTEKERVMGDALHVIIERAINHVVYTIANMQGAKVGVGEGTLEERSIKAKLDLDIQEAGE